MPNLNEIITFEHESEHDLEHDFVKNLSEKKKFSAPKVYNAKGNLKKRWYVYFSYRNPETGKLERMQNIYGIANIHKSKEDRMIVLLKYRNRLLKLLKAGYNPYANNLDLYLATKPDTIAETPKVEIRANKPTIQEYIEKTKQKDSAIKTYTLKEAFDFGINLKKNSVSDVTLQSYKYKINSFLKWIEKNNPEIKQIQQLNKKVVLNYLNELLGNSSSRNRNNHRADLSSVMQVLEENDIMNNNIMKKISVLKTKPNRNKTYTLKEQETIFKYLEKEDSTLLLFIKFVSYNFLRPVEVCRLKIGDINLNTNTLHFKAKNKPSKTKIIPEILLKDLPDISNMDKDSFLFTSIGIGKYWDATENNRRDHFTKRFKSVIKDHFNYGENYGLYSFRHTFITKLYKALVKDSSPFAAKSALMQITGHSSMVSLEKYLRDIDAELPDDYSKMLN